MFHTLLYTAAAFFVLGASRFAYSLAMARGLGAEALGQANLLLAITVTVGLLVSTFTQSSAVKVMAELRGRGDVAQSKAAFRLLAIWSIVGGVAFMAVLALFRGWLADRFGIDETELLWALPLVPLSILYSFLRGAFLGQGRLRWYTALEGLSNLALLAVLVLVTLRGHGALMLPFLACFIVFVAFSLPASVRSWGGRASSATRRTLVGFGAISLFGTFAAALRGQGATLVSGLAAAPAEVGYFGAGFALITVVLFLPGVAVTALTPVLAFHHGQQREGEVRRLLEAGTDYSAFAASLVVVPTVIMAFWVLRGFYGLEFAYAAAPTLRILLIAVFVTMLTPAAISVLTATRHVREPNIAGVLGLVASVIAWAVLVPRFGIEGSAWGYLVGTVVTHGYILVQARRLVDVDLRTTLAMVGTSAAMLTTVLALQPRFDLPALPFALASIVITLAVFRRTAVRLVTEAARFWSLLRSGTLFATR